MSASAVSGEMSAKVDTGEIRRAVALICAPGQVHELRALGTKKGTISGYFTDLDRLARAASWCSLPAFGAEGVCITLNPVRADLLARAANETKPFAKHTTADSEILYYRWLPIDFDPQRPSGISSSAPEHEAARAKAAEVRTYLATLGWQPAIFADSGNGYHLLYRIDLPNEAATSDLLKRVLEALDLKFGGDAVGIDRRNFNGARIWKLYGTVARKGSDLPERPHRLSRMLESVPGASLRTLEMLEAAAGPPRSRAGIGHNNKSNSHFDSNFNVERFLSDHGVEVRRVELWQGGRRFILAKCAFDAAHNGTSVAIVELASGALQYCCRHDGCSNNKWEQFRELFEPGYRERRKHRSKKAAGAKAARQFDDGGERHERDEGVLGEPVVSAEKYSEILDKIDGCPPAAAVEALICRKLYRNDFARDVTRALFSYRGGAYRPRGELLIRHGVKAVVPPGYWSNTLANETVERIRADAPFLWERPPVNLLNLSNGLLDVTTRELRAHDPSHLSPVQLPVSYDENATCEVWDKQARETFPEDACEAGVHWQIVAWLMVAYTALQKALLFLGEGGTGKSTFLRALSAFLGRRNISAESLQQLETGRFSAASLIGRLANICADLPSTHLETSAMFKKITGEDAISTERKFRDCVETTVYARLLFSANVPPLAADATEAFFDRWYVLPFDRRYRGTDEEIRSDELDARLSEPRELSGVLNKALDALPSVLKDGLTVTESMGQALLEFRRMTDPLVVWLMQRTVYDPANDQLMVPCTLLIDEFNRDCAAAGKAGMNNTAFGRALSGLRPAAARVQRTVGGKAGTWVYLRIALLAGGA